MDGYECPECGNDEDLEEVGSGWVDTGQYYCYQPHKCPCGHEWDAEFSINLEG